MPELYRYDAKQNGPTDRDFDCRLKKLILFNKSAAYGPRCNRDMSRHERFAVSVNSPTTAEP